MAALNMKGRLHLTGFHQKPPASLQSPADAGPHDLKEKLYSAARPTSQQKDSFQFQHCAKLYQSFFLCWFRGNTGNFLVMKTYLLSSIYILRQ